MKRGWNITYEIITDESAEHGEAEECGFEFEDTDFRTAIDFFMNHGGNITASCYPVEGYRWLSSTDPENHGECYNVSLHPPDQITDSSRMRIARLVGCDGA
jgi:hypothetical protein